MNIDFLIDKITEANSETLKEYGIDLHDENLKVIGIVNVEEFKESFGRNTEVIVRADGPRVTGSYSYFYNRQILNDIYPEDKSIKLNLTDINEHGAIEALLNSGDESLDLDLLASLDPELEDQIGLYYNPGAGGVVQADLVLDTLEFFFSISVELNVDTDEGHPVYLDEILSGEILEGFDQTIE